MAAVVIAVATPMLGGCWSQFRANQSHTGTMSSEQTLGPGLASKLTRSWSATTGGKVGSSPAFDANNVYVGSDDGKVYALARQNGSVRWTATTGGPVRSSPAVSSSAVYVGSNDGKLYALSPSTGAPLWTFTTGGAVESSPALDGNAVFVGSDDGKVYSLDAASGAQLWSFATAGPVTGAPAVANGLVIVGSYDKTIRALDRASGALVWSVTTGGAVIASPSIVNGIVYVVSFDGVLRALAGGTGRAQWSVPLGTFADSSTAVDNNTLVVAGEDGGLRALDAGSGALRWNASLGSGASSSPAIADGVVYVGTRAGRVSAFNEVNGDRLWSDTTLGSVLSSPAEQSALVTVGSDDGHVYAYAPAPLCGGAYNTIACENSKPGTPQSTWDVNGGDPSIQGYATDFSVNVGETVHFKVSTPARAYHADIYRLGYYAGNGARLVATVQPTAPLPQTQPACLHDSVTNLVDCGNWAESMSWSVPPDAVSGVYFARLTRDDTTAANMILFVVRDDSSHANLLFQTSDTTWEAYNTYGGESLYVTDPTNGHRAYKVSYNRPFDNRSNISWNFLFGDSEYPMLRFLEANGYDVTYASGVDTDRFGSHVASHKVFLSVGHDEYWSKGQRDNVESARAAGVNLAFFSGNESYWKTRWEASTDGSATPYRTLVTYKETLADAKIDPMPVWTGLWRDHRFSPPYDGGRPENAMSGTSYGGDAENCCNSYPMTVSAEEGALRLWRSTSLATLAPNTSATFGDRVVGYEWDEDFDNGYRPAGEIELSTTSPTSPAASPAAGPITGPTGAQPAPSDDAVIPQSRTTTGDGAVAQAAVANQPPVHHVIFFRAASGARVFSAGTNQWGFGVDGGADEHPTPDQRIRQATVNVLADMGVQPSTLGGGLVAASPSSDTQPPSSVITAPAPGSMVAAGSAVTVRGTAQDAGGGKVGGVEVSADGGQTWHPASGRAQWTYSFVANTTLGPIGLRSRATDDSGNVETPGSGISITVTPRACPCTLFGVAVPGTVDSGASQAIEVGTKFMTDIAGSISGLRFYKAAANTGTHVASLWDANGTLLAQSTFASESTSGWQQVSFPTPVAVTANHLYIASYHTATGHVADDKWFSTLPPEFFEPTGFDAAPLHMVSGAGPSGPNDVYAISSTSAFPTQASLDENYWVDVVFNSS